ncbi:MAG: biotin--[acetyl-CoA-carboxylase] ligase [Candidatus Kapabacteria bacterium]|nr:biotin--[acetyl-CoA-carboxylase] ligase [Candidatus Kapabacteria bacterium]
MKQYHFPQIDSTNDFAKELLKTESEIIVTADYQTKGKGRSNRTWAGDYGNNIYYSYGLRHDVVPVLDNIIIYQIIGCLAVKSLLIEQTQNDIFKLKYPNDIMALDNSRFYKKIAGVLAEHSFLGNDCISSIIGIGVNVNQAIFNNEIFNNATSLKLLGYDKNVNELIEKLTLQIQFWLKKDSVTIFNIWKNELNLVGKIVELTSSNDKWQVDSILNDGRLLAINCNSGEQRKIDNGDSVRYKIG